MLNFKEKERSFNKIQLIPPLLVLITGVAGSGKTSLIKNLADQIDCICIDKDEIRKQIDLDNNVLDKKYISNHQSPVYEKLYQEILQSMISGKTILVDAAHRFEINKKGWERKYRLLANQYGYQLKIIRLIVSESELLKRTKERGNPRDLERLNPKSWQDFLSNEPIHVKTLPQDCSLVIINDDLKRATKKVINFIS